MNWYIHRLASLGPNDSQAYLKNPLQITFDKTSQEEPNFLVSAMSAAPSEAKTAEPAAQEKPAEEKRPTVYTVAGGDTLSAIGRRFGITQETIIWANSLTNSDFVKVGQELKIPPIDGVIYKVEKGDTLASIADDYGVEPEAIIGFRSNGLSNPNFLVVGKELMIPGGRVKPKPQPQPKVAPQPQPAQVAVAAQQPAVQPKPAPAPALARSGGSGFSWPTTGPIFTYFSWNHEGIDISPPYGTPVYASRDGVVVETVKLGWSYGWYILVDHGDGYKTRYSHLSEFDVGVGEQVARGQLIGRVGNTGRSTGPHLDFRITKNGVEVNPLDYLP
ncbi:MAG: M23 family metallopeptidase [Chloroflexi bacterium]|nr:M23 family metallopeptidase [Chloroflexota bacterium]